MSVRRPPGSRRVAFLHDNVAFGGIETLQLAILHHLDHDRYIPSVVIAEFDDVSDMRFRTALADLGIPVLGANTASATTQRSALSRLQSLRAVLRREQIDVAHIQTRTPVQSRRLTLAAFLARTPAWAVLPFDRMTDLVITDSNADRNDQIALVHRPPAKVVTSHCGIDPLAFDPHHDVAAAKSALGLDPTRTVIGTVARLHEQKGVRYLLDATRELVETRDDVTVLIVGDGPDEAELRAQTRDAGLDEVVVFAGFQADPLPYMEAMDVVVMPSLWEGFSISMQEFMALGKAMVVTDHHSFAEAIDHGEHGLIVPMRDGHAIAVEVGRLLDDPMLRARLGSNATERARREFSIARHTDELMGFYDAVLDGARA
jgi:glycosyltransferase involved in cell wall biosynthesis